MLPFRRLLISDLLYPALIGLAAGLAAVVYTLAQPNVFRSTARILAADQRTSAGGFGNLAAAAAAVGVSVPGQETADAAYVDILNSEWMRTQLLTTTFAFQVPGGPFRRPIQVHQPLQEFLKAVTPEAGIRALRSRITITRDLKTRLITLSAETVSPELSRLLVQRMATLLEAFITERSQTRGGNKARFARERLKEARIALEQAEKEFRGFLETNRNYSLSPDPSVRLQGGRFEAELKLRQQIVLTLSLSCEQALMDEKNDMPILNVLDKGGLPQEKSGPHRSNTVLTTSFLAFALSWALFNRSRIQTWIVPRTH